MKLTKFPEKQADQISLIHFNIFSWYIPCQPRLLTRYYILIRQGSEKAKMLLTPTKYQQTHFHSKDPRPDGTIFSSKLQSIRDYIDMLDQDPEQAKNVQTGWEKKFYKDELKAALALNHSLIKIMGEKDHEIDSLIQELGQLQKRMSRLNAQKQELLLISNVNDENSQRQSNRKPTTPHKQAFEAQRKILGAKYSQEKEEYEKLLHHREEILKSNKEENVYLREKLIFLSEKLTSYQQENNQLKKECEDLRMKFKNVEKVCRETEQCGKVLDFSPIIRKEDDQDQIVQISFNKSLSLDEDSSVEELKRQVEELKQLLKRQEEKYKHFQSKTNIQRAESKTHEDLLKLYVQLQKELTEKQEEIEQYRAIFAEFNETQQKMRVSKQEKYILEAQVIQLKKTVEEYEMKGLQTENDCEQCKNYISNLNTVKEELEKKKVQLDQIINFALKQHEEWQLLLDYEGLKTTYKESMN